jgi:hypothetical protein
MTLLPAVAAGLLAGLARAWYQGRRLTAPGLRFDWLVPLAFVPQFFTFYLPATRRLVPDNLAAAILVASQALLLAFACFNLRRPAFWALGLGLLSNLLVIALNGGRMPISPGTVAWLAPEAPPGDWRIGDRLWSTKDVVLPIAATRLWWLGDCLRSPAWFPFRTAFSPGDALIAGGAFSFLWALGGDNYGRRNRREGRFRGFRGILSRPTGYFAKRQRVEPPDQRGGREREVLRPAVD